MSLSGSIKVSLNFDKSKGIDLSGALEYIRKNTQLVFTDGVGANQANRIWHDQRTIAASGTEDLDLSGSLADIFGDTFVLAKLKALYIAAAADNTNNVNVSRPASNGVPMYLAAGDGEPVQPGGVLLKAWPTAGGITITAGTGDLITLANSGAGTTVTYDIIVIGSTSS